MEENHKEKRFIGKLVKLKIKASDDWPTVEFYAEFKLENSDHTTSIAEASINTEFILGFLDSMGFVNKNPAYGKDYAYSLRRDLLMEGYYNVIKLSKRYKLIGKLCWLTAEDIFSRPYLIEPINPKDGKTFNIREWKKKEW